MEKLLLGTNIKNALISKGISQRELAKHLDLTDSTISQYIANNRTPDIYTLVKISEFLGVSVNDLLGIDGKKVKTEPKEEIKKVLIKYGKNLTDSEKLDLIRVLFRINKKSNS